MEWLQLLVVLVAMVGTILGVVIPLHIQNISRMDAIHQEMKDFHGRLCAIQAQRDK